MPVKDFYFFNERLTDKLNTIRRKPLTVVKAPMAAGKSTAVISYIDNLKCDYVLHSINSASYEEWLASFVHLLSPYYHDLSELNLPNDNSENISYTAGMISSALKRSLRSGIFIYILDHSGSSDRRIPDLLWCLSGMHVPGFNMVIMSRSNIFGDLSFVLDNSVNYVNDKHFMLYVPEIIQGFEQYGIHLIPEEAALIYRYTNGWMPAVNRVYISIKETGKEQTFECIENIFGSWIPIVSDPKTLGYSDELWETVKCLHTRESFTAEDIVSLGKVKSLPNVYDLPTFLYYDEHSRHFHLHYLLSSAFDVSSMTDPSHLDNVPLSPNIGLETVIADENLRKAVMLILSFRVAEADRAVQKLEYSDDGEDVNKSCIIEICRIAVEYISGKANSGISSLEKKMTDYLYAGMRTQAEMLARVIFVVKLLLGGEWTHDTDDLCEYWLKMYSKNGSDGMKMVIAGIIMLHKKKNDRLLSFMDVCGECSIGTLECLRLLFLAIASARLKENENADKFLMKSMALATDESITLPFLMFNDDIIDSINRIKGREECCGYCFVLRSQLPGFRRTMSGNMRAVGSGDTVLTARQSEIAALIGERFTNKEIAMRLNISENTVKTTVQVIFKKLGVEKRSELYH